MTRTLTGLFDTYDEAESAVRDLEGAGIRHEHISIVANRAGAPPRTRGSVSDLSSSLSCF